MTIPEAYSLPISGLSWSAGIIGQSPNSYVYTAVKNSIKYVQILYFNANSQPYYVTTITETQVSANETVRLYQFWYINGDSTQSDGSYTLDFVIDRSNQNAPTYSLFYYAGDKNDSPTPTKETIADNVPYSQATFNPFDQLVFNKNGALLSIMDFDVTNKVIHWKGKENNEESVSDHYFFFSIDQWTLYENGYADSIATVAVDKTPITITRSGGDANNAIIIECDFSSITRNNDGSITTGFIVIEHELIIEIDDNAGDSQCCDDVQALIQQINSGNFNFGTFTNYKTLIDEINKYVNVVENARNTLSITQIEYVEQYAANIKAMAAMFGQLVVKLSDTQIVDYSALCVRVKQALNTIFTSMKIIKQFRVAIKERDTIKISSCMITISTSLQAMSVGFLSYDNNNNVTGTTNEGILKQIISNLQDQSGTQLAGKYLIDFKNKPDGYSLVGALVLFHESIAYFTDGLVNRSRTTIVRQQGDCSAGDYYQSSFDSNCYVISSFFTNFNLSTDDQDELKKSIELVKSYEQTVSNEILDVMSRPEIVDLKNSFQRFQTLSNKLAVLQLAFSNVAGQFGVTYNHIHGDN